MPQLPPSFTPDFYEKHWAAVARKYDILGEHSHADLLRAQTEASTLPGLREAQSFATRAGGQESLERAGTESKIRQFYDNPDAVNMLHNMLLQQNRLPVMPGTGAPGAEAPGAAPAPTAPALTTPGVPQIPSPVQFLQLPSLQEQQGQLPPRAASAADLLAPAALAAPAVPPSLTGSLTPQAQTPEQMTQSARDAAMRRQQQWAPLQSLMRPLSNPLSGRSQGFRRGTTNVKGKESKASKAGGPPKGLEAMLPLLAAMQGGGAPGPAGPPPAMPSGAGLKKGSANVKGKSGKSKSGDQPGGLEALLSALSAGGAGGAPPAAGTPPMPMAPGATAPPGFARGVSMVRGYQEGSARVDAPAGPHPMGMATLPPSQNIEDRRGQSYTPPSLGQLYTQDMMNNISNKASALGTAISGYPTAAPGSLEAQAGLNAIPHGSRFDPLIRAFAPRQMDTGYAAGTPSVQPNPGYPFGAGYLFGATAVPGQGSGTTDTVPAMLAPHEAVLNRAAADMLGRGLIAALNQRGVRQMGMQRGAPS